jgi:hypothetical protein
MSRGIEMRLIPDQVQQFRVHPELKKVDAPVGPQPRPITGSGTYGEDGRYDVEEPREFRDGPGSRLPESGKLPTPSRYEIEIPREFRDHSGSRLPEFGGGKDS